MAAVPAAHVFLEKVLAMCDGTAGSAVCGIRADQHLQSHHVAPSSDASWSLQSGQVVESHVLWPTTTGVTGSGGCTVGKCARAVHSTYQHGWPPVRLIQCTPESVRPICRAVVNAAGIPANADMFQEADMWQVATLLTQQLRLC